MLREEEKHSPSLPSFTGMLHILSMLILLFSIITQENLNKDNFYFYFYLIPKMIAPVWEYLK